MKVKFNKYERVAGLFVMSVIIASIVAMIGIAVKNGWFETKVKFETTLKNAEGLRPGAAVQMAGLRAGVVTGVELKSNDEVHVWMEVSEKFHDRIREDSIVRAVRPFIIGEKVIDITVGTEERERVKAGAHLASETTMDLMDLISGRTLGPSIDLMAKMVENMRYVAEQLLDPERTKALVQMFDQMAPLVNNMSSMAKEVTSLIKDTNKNKNLVTVVNNLVVMTNELNKQLPLLNEVLPVLAKNSPQLTSDMATIAKNLAALTDELANTLPSLREIGPELPRASRRAIEALDETVVTLKALQKSFLLKGNVKDVRQEEAERERVPAAAEDSKVGNEEKK